MTGPSRLVVSCSHCGAKVDSHEPVGTTAGVVLRADSVPDADDSVTVCWECGEVSIYVSVNGALALRVPTGKEYAEIMASEGIRIVREAVQAHRQSSYTAVAAARGGHRGRE